MDYKEAIEYLYSFRESDIKLGLERIEGLLAELGNPHRQLKVVHVAGTNGKGSVCAMIDTILQESGYKVGRYTSPHLLRFNERIMINSKEISDDELALLLTRIRPLVKDHSFFEIVTAMAFLYFKQQNVDFVVCEVGLGGRFDATNVVSPLVSVITNISLEHTAYLGDSVEKIAFEKAGIVKNNIPTVTSKNGTALDVIRKICSERNSELTVVEAAYNGEINLNGDFQKMNAALAVAAVEKLSLGISNEKIAAGLKKVKWPGRLEQKGNILYDCAHNSAAIKVLVSEIKKLDYKKMILVIGILKDKNIKEMMGEFAPITDITIITKPRIHRAQEPKLIAESAGGDCQIVEDVKEAVEKAESVAGKKDLVVVTGSIYVVGEALR